MAGGAAAKGSSVITLPSAAQALAGKVATTTSRAAAGLRQVFFTAKDMATPETLHRVIAQLQSNLTDALRPLLQNATLTGSRVVNVTFSGVATTTIKVLVPHGLGRPYLGYYAVNDYGLTWFGNSIPYSAAAWPAGVSDTSRFLYLEYTLPAGVTSASWDFLVF